MTRESLPPRRFCETVEVMWGGRPIQIGIGYFDDGRPAEVFVTGVKVGTDVQAEMRDAAIVLSLALQFGCPFETIVRSLTRDENEHAASIIGMVVDRVAEGAARMVAGRPPEAP